MGHGFCSRSHLTSLTNAWLLHSVVSVAGSVGGSIWWYWRCAVISVSTASIPCASVQYDGFDDPVAGPLPFQSISFLVPMTNPKLPISVPRIPPPLLHIVMSSMPSWSSRSSVSVSSVFL